MICEITMFVFLVSGVWLQASFRVFDEASPPAVCNIGYMDYGWSTDLSTN